MARKFHDRDITRLLSAAQSWIERCIWADGSLLGDGSLWTPALVEELRSAFVDHPDAGDDDFMTKLRGQMQAASPAGRHLMAEMMWVLLLFPSNIGAEKKRQHVQEAWSWSGETLPPHNPMLESEVLQGVGSAGTAYNNLRWKELAYLISLVQSMKSKSTSDRKAIFEDYERFMEWIDLVPRDGDRQFRHMLRYFAYPDRVERMSSNRDRISVLEGFKVAPRAQLKGWTDRQLDGALLKLRGDCESKYPGKALDFYEPPLEALWRCGAQPSRMRSRSQHR
jgi:5-methylcytosine-specific restriction enzyme B